MPTYIACHGTDDNGHIQCPDRALSLPLPPTPAIQHPRENLREDRARAVVEVGDGVAYAADDVVDGAPRRGIVLAAVGAAELLPYSAATAAQGFRNYLLRG